MPPNKLANIKPTTSGHRIRLAPRTATPAGSTMQPWQSCSFAPVQRLPAWAFD
jgi:hypothetical protein